MVIVSEGTEKQYVKDSWPTVELKIWLVLHDNFVTVSYRI